MVGWHVSRLWEFEYTLGVGDAQGSLGRRQWHPTPILLPGESHGWRSLVGCSPWGRTESDTTEAAQQQQQQQQQGGLVCCSPWGHRELDMTKQLN